eukprot:16154-Heterococcus_DN1.PRE.2
MPGPIWKSLCQPAILPLTTDYLPSREVLEKNYTESFYTLTLPDSDDPIAKHYSCDMDLLEELICQRIAQATASALYAPFTYVHLYVRTCTPASAAWYALYTDEIIESTERIAQCAAMLLSLFKNMLDFQLVEGDVVSGGAVKSNYSTSSLAFGNTSSNSSSSTMTINNSQLGAYMTHKGKWGYDSSAMITNNSGHKISPNNSSTSTAATTASSINSSSAGGSSSSNSSGQRRSYILSMGHRIHSLSYDDQTKQVEVKRFMSRYGSNAAPGNRYNYTYSESCGAAYDVGHSSCSSTAVVIACNMYLKQRFGTEGKFQTVKQSFYRYPSPEYSWNYLDELVCGYNEELIENTKYRRISFALIPPTVSDQEEEESYIAKMRKLEDYLNSKAEKQDDEKSGKLAFEFIRHFSSSNRNSSNSSDSSQTADSSSNTQPSKATGSSIGVHRTGSSSKNSVQTASNNTYSNSKTDTGSSSNDSSKPDVSKQQQQSVSSTSDTSAAVGAAVGTNTIPATAGAAAAAAATAKRSKQAPRIQQQSMKVNVNDTGSRSSRKDRYEVLSCKSI